VASGAGYDMMATMVPSEGGSVLDIYAPHTVIQTDTTTQMATTESSEYAAMIH